tara:strand:- start:2212 stop:2919 length:708 start_codon:yes stop_codon:yes gene_type:complete
MTNKSGRVSTQAVQSDVSAFLKKVATTPVTHRPGERGRLIFSMDATASREPTWDRACQIQGQMFAETASLGGLEVQMAHYRGFGEFNASQWVNNSSELVRQMTAVFCLGGETQIRKVLRHTIEETKRKRVNALVFVGDCCEEDIDKLCALAGELGLLNVPVFIFHEGGEPTAARAFRQIVKLTKGAYCAFDGSSAKQLRDLLSAVAVYAAGGRKALENFSRGAGSDVGLLTQQIR